MRDQEEPIGVPSADGNIEDPTEDSGGTSTLVVRSIGTASFAIVAALRKILPVAEQVIAERLFRAPSELLSGLPRDAAEKAAALLRSAGLDVDVLAPGQTFVPGEGVFDVALVPTDDTRLFEVAREVMVFLGVDAKTARGILCAAPSVLVGGVSQATVDALRRRFAPLGVDLVVSRPADSVFDVVLGDVAQEARTRILDTLRHAGVDVLDPAEDTSNESMIAAGLDKPMAERVWEQLGRRVTALRVLDRAFERFDVLLESFPHEPAAIDSLLEVTGMPRKVVHKVLERLPVVVCQNIPFGVMQKTMVRIAELGGRATSELVTFQSFSLMIESVSDKPKAAQVLRGLADVQEAFAETLLHSFPARIEGPFGRVHARWLVAELEKTGARVKLVRRGQAAKGGAAGKNVRP